MLKGVRDCLADEIMYLDNDKSLQDTETPLTHEQEKLYAHMSWSEKKKFQEAR